MRALLEGHGLTPGREMADARELWTAVEREGPRMQTPFDEAWFGGLLRADSEPLALPANDRAQDWGEAPDTVDFVGRAEALGLLRAWVMDERCRLVAVLGMGGIGKTSLAAMLAQTVAPHFECVYWRSLRNALPVSAWLAGAIAFISHQQVVPPPSESEQISGLLQLLRARRCLLVLDNSETLFEPGQREGRYRAGMDGYGQILQAVGEASHQSCLLLTGREPPPELAVLAGVRELELHGLGVGDVQDLLNRNHLHGDLQAWTSLVDCYGGNGLALKIVAETIRQLYDGDVARFVQDALATYGTVFGGIRRLLAAQVERLSPVEHGLLTGLAVEREPITLTELSRDLATSRTRSAVIEAIQTLQRRSLVERVGASFTLQSMVLEYVTDQLVETVVDEIWRGECVTLVEVPIILAQAKDYVRQTQERLIGAPILQGLIARADAHEAERRLVGLLDGWRGRPMAEQGYGPGNTVNLLRLLRGHLRGMDLSRLVLRHVYLQGVGAQDVSLAGAHLSEAVFTEAFVYPTAVALSGNGEFLAAGTPSGEVRLWRVADRTLLFAASGHTGLAVALALSEDGRLLVSGGDDGMVRLWQVPGGQPLATLRGHATTVWGVAFSGDEHLVASGSWDGTVGVWELTVGNFCRACEATRIGSGAWQCPGMGN